MGLMSRTSNVVKAWYSKLLDRAEDPSVTLDYSYEQPARDAAERQEGHRRRRHREEAARAADAEARARSCPSSTSRRARLSPPTARISPAPRSSARRSRSSSSRASTSRSPTSRPSRRSSPTARSASPPRSRPSAAQKEIIKAQYSAAEAQVKIGEAATGIGEEMADTGLAIQRAQDKTEQMQARAAAVDELVESGTLEDYTSRRDAARPRARADLDAEPGGRRARAAQGRARVRRHAEGAREGIEVIVRRHGRGAVPPRRRRRSGG